MAKATWIYWLQDIDTTIKRLHYLPGVHTTENYNHLLEHWVIQCDISLYLLSINELQSES